MENPGNNQAALPKQSGILEWRTAQAKNSRWRQLQARLRLLCDERGAKKALCLKLGLRQQALSILLNSRKRQPCAEIALALKEWADSKHSESSGLKS